MDAMETLATIIDLARRAGMVDFAGRLTHLMQLPPDLRRAVFVSLRNCSRMKIMTRHQVITQYGEGAATHWGIENSNDAEELLTETGVVATTCSSCRQDVIDTAYWTYLAEARLVFGPSCRQCMISMQGRFDRAVMGTTHANLQSYSLELDHAAHSSVAYFLGKFDEPVTATVCTSLSALDRNLQQWRDGLPLDHALENEDEPLGLF